MKASIIRGVLIFAAGAGCATVVAGGGWFPPKIGAEELGKRLDLAARELAEIGVYTVEVRDDQVYFQPSPIECTPTPDPDIMPEGALNPTLVRKGFQAVRARNEWRMAGQMTTGLIPAPPCHPR